LWPCRAVDSVCMTGNGSIAFSWDVAVVPQQKAFVLVLWIINHNIAGLGITWNNGKMVLTRCSKIFFGMVIIGKKEILHNLLLRNTGRSSDWLAVFIQLWVGYLKYMLWGLTYLANTCKINCCGIFLLSIFYFKCSSILLVIDNKFFDRLARMFLN
jgi:hypothetical protein